MHASPNTAPSRRLKVINLFGAPGVGKSAVRSGVFWLMKSHHLSVEEVSEYAKYLLLSGRKWQLTEEQVYLFAKQHHKQLVIERTGYEYAVTDSPLHLCPFYAPEGYLAAFPALVDEAYTRFENINFFLTRQLEDENCVFENRGRAHDRLASAEKEQELRAFLQQKNIVCQDMPVDLLTPWRILDHLHPGLAKRPQIGA